jgi:hypothetical protein
MHKLRPTPCAKASIVDSGTFECVCSAGQCSRARVGVGLGSWDVERLQAAPSAHSWLCGQQRHEHFIGLEGSSEGLQFSGSAAIQSALRGELGSGRAPPQGQQHRAGRAAAVHAPRAGCGAGLPSPRAPALVTPAAHAAAAQRAPRGAACRRSARGGPPAESPELPATVRSQPAAAPPAHTPPGFMRVTLACLWSSCVLLSKGKKRKGVTHVPPPGTCKMYCCQALHSRKVYRGICIGRMAIHGVRPALPSHTCTPHPTPALVGAAQTTEPLSTDVSTRIYAWNRLRGQVKSITLYMNRKWRGQQQITGLAAQLH